MMLMELLLDYYLTFICLHFSSNNNYVFRNFMQLIFSAEDSGRLLKYNPITQETTVLLRNLQFPNGVSMSKDGSFFVFCELSLGRWVSFQFSSIGVGVMFEQFYTDLK